MSKGVKKGAIYSLVGQVIGGVSLFAFQILAGRWLGVDHYGDLNALYSAIAIVTGVVATGIVQGLIRFIAHYEAKENIEGVSGAIQSSFIYYSIALFVFIIASFFLKDYISERFFSDKIIVFYQFILGVVTFSLFRFLNGVLQGYRRFKLRALTIMIHGVSILFFLYLIVRLFGKTASKAGWSIVLAPILALVFFKIYKSGIFSELRTKFKGLSMPVLKFALIGTLIGFMSQWFLRAGPLLLKMLSAEKGSYLAGLFSAMIMPLSTVRTVILALLVSLYPNLSRVYSLKDRNRIRRYIFKSMSILGVIVLVSVIIYCFFGPQLIQLLYGKEYIVSSRDTTLVAFSVGFFLFSLLFFRIHLSRGTPKYPSYSFLVSLLVLILMIYFLNLEPLLLVEVALLSCSFLFAFLQLLPIFFSRVFSRKG